MTRENVYFIQKGFGNMKDREQCREKIRDSGLNLSEEKVEKMIEVVFFISDISDVSVEQALDNMLGFMIYTNR